MPARGKNGPALVASWSPDLGLSALQLLVWHPFPSPLGTKSSQRVVLPGAKTRTGPMGEPEIKRGPRIKTLSKGSFGSGYEGLGSDKAVGNWSCCLA